MDTAFLSLFFSAKDFESIRLEPTDKFDDASYMKLTKRMYVRGLLQSMIPGGVYLGFVYVSSSLALDLTLVNAILFGVLGLLYSFLDVSTSGVLGEVSYRAIYSSMADLILPHILQGNKGVIQSLQTRISWIVGTSMAASQMYRVAVYCWMILGSLVVFAITYDVFFSIAVLLGVFCQVLYTVLISAVLFRWYSAIADRHAAFTSATKSFVDGWAGFMADPRKMTSAKNNVRSAYNKLERLGLKISGIHNTSEAVLVATIPVIIAFLAKLFHTTLSSNAFPFASFLTATYLIRDAITNFTQITNLIDIHAKVRKLLDMEPDPSFDPDCIRPCADGVAPYVTVDGAFSWKEGGTEAEGGGAAESGKMKRGTLNAKTVDILWNVSFEAKDRDLLLMVGGQGTGKTSLCDMLMGYMVKRSGSRDVCGKLCLVPQSPLIFGATIKENVILDQAWEPNLFLRIIKAVGLDKDFKVTEASWDRSVGARGSGLSSGQRVRLGAARAAYQGPQIILIDSLLDALDQRVAASVMTTYVCGLLSRSIRIVCVAEATFKVPTAHRAYSIDILGNLFEPLDTNQEDEGGLAGLSLLQLEGTVSGSEVGVELTELEGDGMLGVRGALTWALRAVDSRLILVLLVGLNFLRGFIFSIVYQIGTVPSDPLDRFVTIALVIMAVAYLGGSIVGMVLTFINPYLSTRWFVYVMNALEGAPVKAFRAKPLAAQQALVTFYLSIMVHSTMPLLMTSVAVTSNAVSLMLNIISIAPEFGAFLLLYAIVATYFLNTKLDTVSRVAQRDTIIYEELTDEWDEYGSGHAEMHLYGSRPDMRSLYSLCSLTFVQMLYINAINSYAGVMVFTAITTGYLLFAFYTNVANYALVFSLLIGVTNTAPKMLNFGVLAATELGIIPRFRENIEALLRDVPSGTSMPQGPFVLETEKLQLQARDTELVKGVSIRFEEFARTVIIGRTGSGKSLLASSLVRLDGLDLVGGRVTFGGMDVSETRRKIATSFIRYMPATPCLVGDNVADFVLCSPANEETIVRLCAEVGLLDSNDLEQLDVLRSTGIDDLTHSEKQVLCAIRLLVANDFLCAVLDEFTSSLYDEAEDLMLAEVTLLPTSVVIIHHRLQAAWRMSHVAEMADGVLLYHSTMASAISRPEPNSLLESLAPELREDPNFGAPALCTSCKANPPVARIVSESSVQGPDAGALWKCSTCVRS
jgi:ABC-type transport system involved in cytochrome bd biosynthesis fused ATPase/permease subunit